MLLDDFLVDTPSVVQRALDLIEHLGEQREECESRLKSADPRPCLVDLKASSAAICLLLLTLDASEQRILEPVLTELWHEYRRPRLAWPAADTELVMLDAALVLASGSPEPAQVMVDRAAHHDSHRRCSALGAMTVIADRLEVFADALCEAADVNLRSRQAGDVDSALLALCAVRDSSQRVALIDRWLGVSRPDGALALRMARDGFRVEIGVARTVEAWALRYLAFVPNMAAGAVSEPIQPPVRVKQLVTEARLAAATQVDGLRGTPTRSVGSLLAKIAASPLAGVTLRRG